jgi:hypothetical protein
MQGGWTILVFICEEDPETKYYADALLQDLLKTTGHPGPPLFFFESVREKGSQGPLKGSLSQLLAPEGLKIREKKLLKDFGVVDPGNESVLKGALEYLHSHKLIAEHLLLITWDHGAGFGLFSGDPRTHPGEAGTVSGKKIMVRSPTRINMLTCIEINRALGSLGRRTDLVIMMNCWTQMLEMGYQLAENVDFLVAPETADYFAGYDYDKIIDAMGRDPGIAAGKIAILAVDSIAEKFRESPTFKNDLKEIVVAAVCLAKSTGLVAALDKSAAEILQKLPGQAALIRSVREDCHDLTKGYFLGADGKPDDSIEDHYIDLLYFLSALHKRGIISGPTLGQFKEAADAYLVRLFRGEKFDQEEPYMHTKPANGFSIYHPDQKADFQSVYYEYFYRSGRIRMASTAWGAYLEAYQKNASR